MSETASDAATALPGESPTTASVDFASLAGCHAPSSIRRWLGGRQDALVQRPAVNRPIGDIQGPRQGLLCAHGRVPPIQKAVALSLAMLRQLVATCDPSVCGSLTAPAADRVCQDVAPRRAGGAVGFEDVVVVGCGPRRRRCVLTVFSGDQSCFTLVSQGGRQS